MSRSLADLDWPTTTERLSLRPAEPRDALPTFAFRSMPAVAEWLTSLTSDQDTWVEGFGGRLGDTLVIEKDGVVIGDLMLRVEDPWSQTEVRAQAAGTVAEIGYVLDPTYAGQGYATEAACELLRICFEEVGVRRVIAQCFADNTASWRLMERLGMRREQHTKQDSLHRNGQWLDGMMYALLADEWHAAR
ncbi:MAG TPA: GNAT family protein [Nocardioides sp.]|uniref:GNAT family N-acetyltransferase n=1 Tax=uncultured Nocardioides sp. TaxID=198441 RepID=UPI000EE4CCEF|nr:GNAT family protein [uncultured Nocardioides sp.]HCB06913.1 N-acetyltransferase [Nocardioides sp.]HRD61357.1 GNAT family protein [Nocardioides sp.]HRI97488.1 GNAT family protein [Nocardioides sp.]HRK45546.1 GNAT family protein [Nocardioides sp.]